MRTLVVASVQVCMSGVCVSSISSIGKINFHLRKEHSQAMYAQD